MERVQAVRGMNDILPDAVHWWQKVEATARQVLELYGYREIRTPLVEKLELFARSIGESTDIVEKEMYAFADSKGQWLALRPEATASMVRAFIEHNLHADPLARKFYTIGPMFRHERPQKGRYRQFHQIDAEVFGIDDPLMDAEVMVTLCDFLQRLGLRDTGLHVNSLGCPACRPRFREDLKAFLQDRASQLCPDCDRRRHVNPLRVFDCKVDRCRDALNDAPELGQYLCEACRRHFDKVLEYLSHLHVAYDVDSRMVRGLDYYMRTTFEVITDRLGAQNAVGGGGRYDGLMRDLGGPDLPGIGFAIGMERLILLLQQEKTWDSKKPDVFIAVVGDEAVGQAFRLAQDLRTQGVAAELGHGGGSLKSQMRRANKMGAAHVVIVGEEELAKGAVVVRHMVSKEQRQVPLEDVAAFLAGKSTIESL
ncbi:histidine--tRNA ligase [Desulfosoma caldarium]|uniref:Histidine--tRNA ligase n=1 Tax=Desulfosoma caldarium TaxID=610254 RepID=A0A3N1ULW5_9BACT|nr:histidine--tRNA ligase [Desulfosoma caldarium]ROQ92202.1 histidyl-tRNA synthetase [Desulfosoma caldarium]